VSPQVRVNRTPSIRQGGEEGEEVVGIDAFRKKARAFFIRTRPRAASARGRRANLPARGEGGDPAAAPAGGDDEEFSLTGLCWFQHIPTGVSWSLPDPVAWCRDHGHDPSRGRARERLVTLGPDGPDRFVPLITRRCGLALIHALISARVVVHCWGQTPDLQKGW
jgi:hypothetical protein